MNIFYLDQKQRKCAEEHCDKHVVKMVLEYAQLLSTAHRVIDGEQYIDKTKNGRNIKRWKMKDSGMESNLYKATHINHPSAVWVRESKSNYNWLFYLWMELMCEYTERYNKSHACEKLIPFLKHVPKNISEKQFISPPQCMPDHCKHSDTVEAYRNFYRTEKKSFATWKTSTPSWFT